MNCISRGACLLALILPLPALAQNAVVIWPVDPRIEAGQQATAIWLENRGDAPVMLQMRSFGWDQSDGEDHQTKQQTIVASPPIAEVAPGERQLVRIIRRGPAESGERPYRLIIDELPRAHAEGTGARLEVKMRYSLPLFVHGGPREDAKPALDHSIVFERGEHWLVLHNGGTGHARLTELTIEQNGATAAVRSGLVGYVLPGATMRWPLPALAQGARISVRVNGDPRVFAHSG